MPNGMKDVKPDITKRSPSPERKMSWSEQQFRQQQAEGPRGIKRKREAFTSEDTQRSEKDKKRVKVEKNSSDENRLSELIMQQYEYLKDHYKKKEQNHFLAFKKAGEIVEEKEIRIQELIQKANTAFIGLDIKYAHVDALKDNFEETLKKLEKTYKMVEKDLKTEYSKKYAKEAHNYIKGLSQAPMSTTLEGLENFRACLEQQTNIKIQHFDKRKELCEQVARRQDDYIGHFGTILNNLSSFLVSLDTSSSHLPPHEYTFDEEQTVDIAHTRRGSNQGGSNTPESSNTHEN